MFQWLEIRWRQHLVNRTRAVRQLLGALATMPATLPPSNLTLPYRKFCMQNTRKQFVAPKLNEEKDLATLTLTPATSGAICRGDDYEPCER